MDTNLPQPNPRSARKPARPLAKPEGKFFLDQLVGTQKGNFAGRFARLATRLGLDIKFGVAELDLLYQVTFLAALCNIAFNGRGRCGGEIKPEKEPTRWRLEQQFMDARTELWASDRWAALPLGTKNAIDELFLHVSVTDENLRP